MAGLTSILFAALVITLIFPNAYAFPMGNEVLTGVRIIGLDLKDFFNIKAASPGLNDTFADFDGSGRAYPVEWLPNATTFTYNGIKVRI